MPRTTLRPAPLPRYAITFQRRPTGTPRTVVVEGFSAEGAGQAIRRYLGDDAPDRPEQYLLTCEGRTLPSPFAPVDAPPTLAVPALNARRTEDDWV